MNGRREGIAAAIDAAIEADMTTISPLRDETDRDWNAEWLAEVRRVTRIRITKKLTALAEQFLAEQFVDDRASLAAMMDGAQDAVMNWTPPK